MLQLRLFPAPRPLVQRLGEDFFRRIPKQPGVYLMRDQQDRLIYVGKARNLRQRLGSYRYLGGASRKTTRLVHAVRRIDWEVCPSEPAARLRENELLRRHRPRFNRANTWPRAYWFIQLRPCAEGLELVLTADPQAAPAPALASEAGLLPLEERIREPEFAGSGPEPIEGPLSRLTGTVPPSGGEGRDQGAGSLGEAWNRPGQTPHWESIFSQRTFGAFKAGASLAFGALLRLLWAALHQPVSLEAWPRQLWQARPPRRFTFSHPHTLDWVGQVRAFLAGESAALVENLRAASARPASRFEEQSQQADLAQALEFFERGPQRNHQVCRKLGRATTLVAQEELDDFLVLHEEGVRGKAVEDYRSPRRFVGPAATGNSAGLGARKNGAHRNEEVLPLSFLDPLTAAAPNQPP